MKRLVGLTVVLMTVLLLHESAEAQRRTPRYRTSPAISPYMNLFGGNRGGTANYFLEVRPRQRILQFASDTDRQLESNRQLGIAETQAIEQTIEEGVLQLRQPSTSTSRAATFMNYSRFFPQQNPTRGRRR